MSAKHVGALDYAVNVQKKLISATTNSPKKQDYIFASKAKVAHTLKLWNTLCLKKYLIFTNNISEVKMSRGVKRV